MPRPEAEREAFAMPPQGGFERAGGFRSVSRCLRLRVDIELMPFPRLLEGLRAEVVDEAVGMSGGARGKADMSLYEHIFMSRPDVTSQQVEGLIEQYKSIIETGGGKVTKQEYWGVKSLAYR